MMLSDPQQLRPSPSPCICTCCSGSCCRGLPTSCRFRLFFCATDGERYFCNDRLRRCRPSASRPSICGRGRGKKAPCAVQITVDRCGDLPPPVLLPLRNFFFRSPPLPSTETICAAAYGDNCPDPRPRRRPDKRTDIRLVHPAIAVTGRSFARM